MKRIAIIKKEFHAAGGLEKVTRRISTALKERGCDITLFTSDNVPTKSRLGFKKLLEFDREYKKLVKGFDIVLSMDRASFQTHHRAGNGVHAAYLELRRQHEGFFKGVSFALNPLHRVILRLEKATFEDPHLRGVIVNSNLVRDQILHYYATPPEKIHVIHNGVEWHEMEADFNASLNRRSDRFEFLFVGHNFERKGLKSLLEALSRLNRRDFHLSVVGTDKNLEYYKAMAQKLRLSVTFHGAQSNTRPFYQAADVLVIPSLYDPFANVTVEALAMGLFVVSSKNNGGHEVLTPESGTLFENLDSAFNHPKTLESAQLIRNSIRHLDYSNQLEKVCQICLI